MNDRTANILDAAIQEFIETGDPVSSGRLYERYDFGIKPAMIRLELDTLEADGYLEQPYHSAGRVPSDAGYEFYVTRALAAREERLRSAELKNLLERRAFADLLSGLSSELKLLSVAMDQAADEIYKTGLAALVDHLAWQDRGELRSVIRDFESVDERLPRAAGELDDTLRVFIGRKSPVTRSEHLSVVCAAFRTGAGGDIVSIFAIGPKRMDYKKAIRIFRSL